MAKKVAYTGVLSALTVILIYFAALVPSGKLSLYALSSLPAALVVMEFGIGAGALLYVSASLLSFLLAGFFGSFPYIVFFGLYSLLKYYIEKSNKRAYEVILKIITFNILLSIYYFLAVRLFAASIGMPDKVIYLLIAAAQFVFFVYDYVFSRLLYYYQDNIRNKLMKG